MVATPSKDQAEVILVGCGCPLRGSKYYISDEKKSSYLVHLTLNCSHTYHSGLVPCCANAWW